MHVVSLQGFHGGKEEAFNVGGVGSHWVSVSETHLIMLTCEPHTVRAQAVLIGDSIP